jgi:hypothetical protein
MKKILTVIAFAAVMLFSVTNISAQSLTTDQNKPETAAKAQVAKLSETLNLSGDQQRTLYRAYVANEVNYSKHITGKDANDPTVKANKVKYDAVLDATMKKELTPEQYKQWLNMK